MADKKVWVGSLGFLMMGILGSDYLINFDYSLSRAININQQYIEYHAKHNGLIP